MTRPGLRMPSGSSAVLIARMTRTASAPRWISSQSRRADADAVLAGDRAAELERGPVQVGLGPPRSSPRPAGRRGRTRGPGAGCRRRRARTSRSGRRAWRRSPRSRGACRARATRGTPTSSIRTVAEPLERVVGGPSRLAQPVGLLRVGGADHVRRAAARQAASARSSSSAAAPPGMSDSIMQHRRRRPVEAQVFMSSTAAIVNRSISSSVTGRQAGGGDPGDRVVRRRRASGRRPASSSAAAARDGAGASPR